MMNKIILLSFLLLSTSALSADVKPSLESSLASKKLLTDIVKVGDRLVAVGDRGHILSSQDAVSWRQAKVPVNVLLTDVFFLNDQLGWAVGHDATITATKDGGTTWTIQHHAPEIDKPFFSIYFKDANNGIVIGAYGLFLRTVDGGKTWNKEFHGEFLHPDDLDYLNELKAEDPEAYEDETNSILPHFNRLAIDGDTLYLAGEVGLMASSDDFGVTWQRAEEFYAGSFFDIAKVSDNNILIGGLRSNLFQSNDSGATWQQISFGGTTSINRIFVISESKVVLLGNSGLLYISNDGGKQFKPFVQSDGKAITGGVMLGDKLVLSSEVGIKVIDTKDLAGGF